MRKVKGNWIYDTSYNCLENLNDLISHFCRHVNAVNKRIFEKVMKSKRFLLKKMFIYLFKFVFLQLLRAFMLNKWTIPIEVFCFIDSVLAQV